MGAAVITAVLPDQDPATLRQAYSQMSDQAAYEDGNSYSGNWNMCPGLVIHDQVLQDRQAAHDFLDERAQKWEAAHAVRFHSVKSERVKEPTFAGKPNYGYQGTQPIYTRNYLGQAQGEIVAADQLGEQDKARVLKLATEFENAELAARRARAGLEAVGQRIVKLEAVKASEIAAAQRQARKANAELAKASEALRKLEAKLVPKLYASKSVDEGQKWLLLGVAAE
jgi:hypothetical protein